MTQPAEQAAPETAEVHVSFEGEGLTVDVFVKGDETWSPATLLDRAHRAAAEAMKPETA